MKSIYYQKNPSVLLIIYMPKNELLSSSSSSSSIATPSKNKLNCVNCIVVNKNEFMQLNPNQEQINPKLDSKWSVLKKLWIFRVNLVDYLLNHLPYNFLLSDIDALWLHNPLKYINNLQKENNNFNLDIIGSRGKVPITPLISRCLVANIMYLNISDNVSDTIDKMNLFSVFPNIDKITNTNNNNNNNYNSKNNNNRTLLNILDSQLIIPNDYQNRSYLIGGSYNKICMGFVYFKNSYSVRMLFNSLKLHILTQVESQLDDQRSLNHMIGNYSIFGINRVTFAKKKHWNSINENVLPGFWQKDLLIEKYNVSNHSQTLGIALLAMDTFIRYCDNWTIVRNNTIVAHCLSNKNKKAKNEFFQKQGLLAPTDSA